MATHTCDLPIAKVYPFTLDSKYAGGTYYELDCYSCDGSLENHTGYLDFEGRLYIVYFDSPTSDYFIDKKGEDYEYPEEFEDTPVEQREFEIVPYDEAKSWEYKYNQDDECYSLYITE